MLKLYKITAQLSAKSTFNVFLRQSYVHVSMICFSKLKLGMQCCIKDEVLLTETKRNAINIKVQISCDPHT